MGYDYCSANQEQVLTHARALHLHPEFDLKGAVDCSSVLRSKFERKYEKPTFRDVEAALRELEPDIVVISTPSPTHRAVLKQVISVWRPILILCEKPIALSLNEATDMVKTCKENNVDLFVNYIRRADEACIQIRSWIQEGKISTPIKANVWYSKGVLNNGSHFLNMLEFWLGEILGAKLLRDGRKWQDIDPEPDFTVDFKHGQAVFRSVWEESYSHYSVELLSPSGRLRYDYGGEHVTWQGTEESISLKGARNLKRDAESIANNMNNYQYKIYDHVNSYFKGEPNSLCTGTEALKSVEVITNILNWS